MMLDANKYDITVAIVSYKYGHLVANCIESVLSQTIKPKIVVIDDGAHDGVEEVARMYNVPSVIRPENLGMTANFDTILQESTADRLMFLGADNHLRPDAIEKLAEQDADIVSSDIALTGELSDKFKNNSMVIDYEFGHYIWRFVEKDINEDNYIHGSSLFNAKFARQFRMRGNKEGKCQDWELWKDIMNNGGTHIHVPEPLLYYRRHRHNFNKI